MPQTANAPRSAEHDPVVYPDGSVLLRPQEPKGARLIAAAVIVIAAIILGVIGAMQIANNFIYAADNQKAEIETMLRAGCTYDAPALINYAGMGNEDFTSALQAAGYTLHALPATSEANDIDVVKTNGKAKEADIDSFYTTSETDSNATSAVAILQNSWRLSVNRSTGESLRIRYADFTSGSIEAALKTAMATQGLSDDQVSAEGTDESGNTYKEGVIEANGTTYSWRISATGLSEVYSIKNLPESAFFVGIRLTAQ